MLAVSLLLAIAFSRGQDDVEVVPLEDQFQCNFCLHSQKEKDVMDGVNQNPDCMNHLKFGSRTDLRRICTSSEKYCISTVTNLNGFFVLVERDCAEECIPGCQGHGFGLYYTECTRCCRDTLCNEWDGKQYYMPNKGHRTPLLSVFLLLIIAHK